MIPVNDLMKLARTRLADAEALIEKESWDGSIYLCGYAIELTLKARICKTLKWNGFPSSNNEFHGLQSFKVHDLDMLLHLTNRQSKIIEEYEDDWSNVSQWNPSIRYNLAGSTEPGNARTMIASAKILIRAIWR